MKRITLEDVKSDADIRALIEATNHNLEVMGYTEHGLRHVGYISRTTANILRELGYDERTVELGAITGWIHDIGNAINRKNHGLTGAGLAFGLLKNSGMDMTEIATVMGAIGNHEEETGIPVSPVSAALIIADKSDAHRSRVRRDRYDLKDIHDRVNMSIKKNSLVVDAKHRVIRLVICMDETSALMEYLQIYLSRMILSEKAAAYLGCSFELVINGALINRQTEKPSPVVLTGDEREVSAEE
ncbi:MAG: phosphohydrolase [Christensenellales bacterium]